MKTLFWDIENSLTIHIVSTDNKSLFNQTANKKIWSALTFDKEQEVNEGVEQELFFQTYWHIPVNLSCE